MTLYAGVDIGSRTGKMAVIDEKHQVVATSLLPSTGGTAKTYAALRNSLPADVLSQLKYTVATGYGRVALEKEVHKSVTEITCHYLGVTHFYPSVRTIVDIGGQDSKVITLDDAGRVKDFLMNDRCAAGTGRFLEVMADRVGWTMEQMAALDASTVTPTTINATCTVFAESEVVSLLAQDTDLSVIVSSVALMVAHNVYFMIRKIHGTAPVFMSGGVSAVAPVRFHLSQLMNTPIATDKRAPLMGAVGAALIASGLQKSE